MKKLLLSLNIVAAAIAISGAAGAVSQAILIVGMPGTYSSRAAQINAEAWQIPIAGVLGAVLGTVPAIIVICVTRARLRPWAAAPVLLLGALLGFFLLAMPLLLGKVGPQQTAAAYIELIGAPTLGGLAAAWFFSHRMSHDRTP